MPLVLIKRNCLYQLPHIKHRRFWLSIFSGTGCHPQSTFSSAGVQADYNGEYLIDDMVLDDFQFNGIEGIGNVNGALSAGINGDKYRWPNGELPYII